jgi:hypothetical protein
MKARIQAALVALVLATTGIVGGFAAPANAALTYFYAGGRQTYTTTGAGANFGIGIPAITSGDFHSLFEISVSTTDQNQAVEAGWTVDPGTYGDSHPHLLVSKWVNGAFGGYNDASWNDWAANDLDRGADLSAYVGGAEKSITIQYQGTGTTGWWVFFDGSPVGWFSSGLWTSPTFAQSGKVQLFGEVAANVAAPCTNMGNSIYPNGLTYPAAGAPLRISNTTYADGTTNVNLTLFRTNSAYYETAFQPSTSVRSMAIGGTGNAC